MTRSTYHGGKGYLRGEYYNLVSQLLFCPRTLSIQQITVWNLFL